MKRDPLLCPFREQLGNLNCKFGEGGQIFCFGICNKNDVQVRAIIDFSAAQFAEANNNEGRLFDFVFSHDDFECVLQASISKSRKFDEILFKVSQAQNVAKADAHEFSLMIAPEPEELVFVLETMPQIGQGFVGSLALAESAARDQLIN